MGSPVLGGAAIAAGYGYRAPAVVGVILAVGGLAIAVVSIRLERSVRSSRPEAEAAGELDTAVRRRSCGDCVPAPC